MKKSAMLFFLSLSTAFVINAQGYIFSDPEYSFQLIRTMGYSATGGADIKECIYTASRITEGDNESWFREWKSIADRLDKTAGEFLAAGHKQSAREVYFRASNYYRTAEFFLHTNVDDPRILDTWGKSRSSFLSAIELSESPVNLVRIPFEDTSLPGYLCLVDNSGKKRSLLIVHSGFDGTAEEIYFEIGKLAVERGFNCLLIEGPGQGEVIRKQNIPFRPNWESVITPVMDYALELPMVDPERIGLMGISFGGFFAPRAAAYEHRLKVCVANGGIYSFYENIIGKCPPNIESIISDSAASKEFDKEIRAMMNSSVDLEWSFANGMFTFGADVPSEFIRLAKPYTMKDHAAKIRCTMLVVDSEEDKSLPGQARELFDALECDKEFMLFTTQEGAEEHCQMGAVMISGERILNWLEDNLMK